MSADSDLIKLYSQRILSLAADIPHLGHLATPSGAARKRSPLCGSTVAVEVEVEASRITGFAQDVKACALGQASAAIVGKAIIGRTLAEVERAREELSAMLKEEGPVPSAPFGEYEVLLPARDYRNRHASILLTLEATEEAMRNARAAA
jgi:NifU-like protein involved in Fe-S cluster formation